MHRAVDAQRGAEDAGRAGRSRPDRPIRRAGRRWGPGRTSCPADVQPDPVGLVRSGHRPHDEVGRPRRRRAARRRRPDRPRVGGTLDEPEAVHREEHAQHPGVGRSARSFPGRQPRGHPVVAVGDVQDLLTQGCGELGRLVGAGAPATRGARARPGPRSAAVGGRDRSPRRVRSRARSVGVQQSDRLRSGGQVRVVPHQRSTRFGSTDSCPRTPPFGEGVEADVGDHAVVVLRARGASGRRRAPEATPRTPSGGRRRGVRPGPGRARRPSALPPRRSTPAGPRGTRTGG